MTIRLKEGDAFTMYAAPHVRWWQFWKTRRPVLTRFEVKELIFSSDGVPRPVIESDGVFEWLDREDRERARRRVRRQAEEAAA